MIHSNLRHDNWWSRDNFSNQIADADKACRSSEISVDLIIIIVFLLTYSYFCYILTSFFWYRCANILDVYLTFLFVCTESLTLVSDPTSRRFIRWLLFQTFIYICIKSKGIYQPENLMSNESSRHADAVQTK